MTPLHIFSVIFGSVEGGIVNDILAESIKIVLRFSTYLMQQVSLEAKVRNDCRFLPKCSMIQNSLKMRVLYKTPTLHNSSTYSASQCQCEQ